ncbi:MAG: prepilin-type N-terminal cleavage/methylation domain-containing protein [Colwellia sp.]|nr:prepilin-type N-terminal cleavage/methylation domain-containing protein [Colwellia sp.]
MRELYQQKGFTLIELVIVIIILGILSRANG